MKQRKHRKHALAKVRYGNAFNWWFDGFIRRSVTHFNSLPKAMQEAFHERQLQQE